MLEFSCWQIILLSPALFGYFIFHTIWTPPPPKMEQFQNATKDFLMIKTKVSYPPLPCTLRHCLIQLIYSCLVWFGMCTRACNLCFNLALIFICNYVRWAHIGMFLFIAKNDWCNFTLRIRAGETQLYYIKVILN